MKKMFILLLLIFGATKIFAQNNGEVDYDFSQVKYEAFKQKIISSENNTIILKNFFELSQGGEEIYEILIPEKIFINKKDFQCVASFQYFPTNGKGITNLVILTEIIIGRINSIDNDICYNIQVSYN